MVPPSMAMLVEVEDVVVEVVRVRVEIPPTMTLACPEFLARESSTAAVALEGNSQHYTLSLTSVIKPIYSRSLLFIELVSNARTPAALIVSVT